MKQPKLNDIIKFRFAGMTRVGVVIEIKGTGKEKQWIASSNGIYYPGLMMDRKKDHHILKIIDAHE